MKKKKTVGSQAVPLLTKEPESRDPIELQREMQKDYIDELIHTVQRGKQQYFGDFFVVVLTKNERLLPNVFRNYFFPRATCPTPDYDQTVFHYIKEAEKVLYLWTIPSRDACIHLKNNADKVVDQERELLNFIEQFDNGTLLKVSKRFNGEVLASDTLQK